MLDLHQKVVGQSSLTVGELLGFILFFLIIYYKPAGKFSVWVALTILFIAVVAY